MSENTAAKEVIIDLAREDRACELDPSERLQVYAYEKAITQLKKSLKLADQIEQKRSSDKQNFTANNKPLDRIHNTIFIDGERGTGKTFFMLNLESAYNRDLNEKGEKDGLYFCQPIDPTLLSIKEDFLNVVIGQIHSEVELYCTNNYPEEYIAALEQITDALESESTAKQSFGMDRMLAFKGSLEVERRLFNYFAAAKDALNKSAIVLLIDDVDMSLEVAFQVLEVIRKYLACPFTIPVVSGDKAQYHTLVYKHFCKQLALNGGNPTALEQSNAKQLADRYLQKLFPEYSQIQLKTLPQLIEGSYVRPILKLGEQSIDYKDFYQRLELISISGATNIDAPMREFMPHTSRELIQLNALLFDYNQKENHLVTVLTKNRSALTSLFNEIKLLQALVDYTNAQNRLIIADSISTTINLLNINQTHWMPLRTIGLFDLSKHRRTERLSYYHKNTIEQLDNGIFSNSDILAQRKYLDNLPKVSMGFPKVELFTTKLKIAKSRVNELTGSDEQLLLSLYTHNDYFNHDQTGYLIFFGKIIELIITSIYQDLTANDLTKLIEQPPFHSFFHYFPNTPSKQITDDNDELEEDELEEDELEEDEEKQNQIAYEDHSKKINQWRHDNLESLPLSASLLHSVFYKYIENVCLLKSQEFLQNETIYNIHQRIKLITLNAFASFDLEAQGLSKQGIALGEHFNADNANKSLTYRRNIAPLLDKDLAKKSYTQAINNHPIWEIEALDDFYISDDFDSGYWPERWALQNLDCISSVVEREQINNMRAGKSEIDKNLISELIGRIAKDDEMAKHKEFYSDRKINRGTNFGKLYEAARMAKLHKQLDDWLKQDA